MYFTLSLEFPPAVITPGKVADYRVHIIKRAANELLYPGIWIIHATVLILVKFNGFVLLEVANWCNTVQ